MGHQGSYNPEDNKLRLYPSCRLDSETYAAVKAAGFKWAPKQELFVAPSWSPAREDLLLELCEGEIGDEDYSALERSADRAERFEGYRDKRASEAGASADAFESGPSAFGHQDSRRAERQAQRHDRKRLYACSQWSKAEYWQSRTQAVISHALHKASASVRRGRIKELEAEQRKHEKSLSEYATRWEMWRKVAALEGADTRVIPDTRPGHIGIDGATAPAARLAYALANTGGGGWEYVHPRSGKASSLYSHLTDAQDPITAAEAARLWLEGKTEPGDPDSHAERWSRHYEMRLAYERAMLANEGGAASDADMEVGGWIRGGRSRLGSEWRQIQQVHKSPATGRVTSVKVYCTEYRTNHKTGAQEPVQCLASVNIERLPEGAYRAPTDKERAAFAEATAQRKASEKAAKPKAPPLINPTDEDAEKLQALWNEQAKEAHKRNNRYGECPIVAVRHMTQAEYSARSKGAYGTCETSNVSENLRTRRVNDRERETVFKVRTASPGVSSFSACRAVVILTDKPRKAIPWEDVTERRAAQPTAETLRPRLWELAEVLAADWLDRVAPEMRQLIDDAVYVGWAYVSSLTQFGWTETGRAEFEKVYNATGNPSNAAAV